MVRYNGQKKQEKGCLVFIDAITVRTVLKALVPVNLEARNLFLLSINKGFVVHREQSPHKAGNEKNDYHVQDGFEDF